jgi:hypothetical protein
VQLRDSIVKLAELRDGVLVLAALVYGCGYVSLAFHAWRLGLGLVPGFELQYFTAGIVPFALTAFVYWVIRHGRLFIASIRENLGPTATGTKRFFRYALPCCVVVGLAVGAAADLLTAEPKTPLAKAMMAVGAFLVSVGFIFFPPEFIIVRRPAHEVVSGQRQTERVLSVISIIYFNYVGVLISLMVLSLYVRLAYPLIPQEFGGIRPRDAVLDVRTKDLSDTTRKALGILGGNAEAVAETKTVSVVFQTGDRLWIRVSSSTLAALFSTSSILENRLSDA